MEYDEKDIASEASKRYDWDRLFASARERFPGYNDEQSLDALDCIVNRLESAFSGNYTDAQWQAIADHLSEHVQNGIT